MTKKDFDIILGYIKKIKKENLLEGAGINKKSWKYRTYQMLPRKLKEDIIHPISAGFRLVGNKKENLFSWNDQWALNFLIYTLEKKEKINFNLNLFGSKDKEEIMKFIRNKIFLAISHNVRKKDLFDKEDFLKMGKYKRFLKLIKKTGKNYYIEIKGKKYILPINHFEIGVFYNKYGINIIPEKVKEKIKSKDFVDCGAFMGDSSLILEELKPSKIYAFEPLKENFNLMEKTIQLNKSEKIIPVKKGVGVENKKAKIIIDGPGSKLSKVGTEGIEVTTIDNFVDENQLDLGLIKMDIEGGEYNAILGAKKTIKKFKPVLLIALYHNGRDFFEIPRIIKKLVPTYEFRFINLDRSFPFSERVLLAY